MTAIAPVSATLVTNPLQNDVVPLAHRRLQAQLTTFGASDYSPDKLVAAVDEFCRTRCASAVPPAQVLIECTTLAAARLDAATVRLIEVLARPSIDCSVAE